MKIRNFLNLFLFVAIGMLTITSCEDDGSGTGTTTGPTISFGLGSGDDITVNPEEVFTVRVSAEKGANEMNSFSIFEDGALVSFDRLTINGVAAASNSIVLFGADRSSLTWDIDIVAHSGSSTNVYTFEVNDQTNTRSVSLNVTTNSLPPVLTYNGPASFNSSTDANNSIKLSATKGSGKITTMAVYENGVLIEDVTRLELEGTDFDANPYTLQESLQDGWTDGMLILKTSFNLGAQVYTVEIADEFSNTSSQEFTINVGEPLDATIVGVLLNKSGPAGTGGLDLDDGMGLGSGNMLVEIKDEGNVTLTSTEWRQQISGANSSIVKYVIPNMNGVPEDFTFGGVEFKEQVLSAYIRGVDFTATNSSGDLVSNVVVEGDIFAVKNLDKYYLLEVTEVSVTTGDNADFYRFNIKK